MLLELLFLYESHSSLPPTSPPSRKWDVTPIKYAIIKGSVRGLGVAKEAVREDEETGLVFSRFFALRSLAIARLHCLCGNPPPGFPVGKLTSMAGVDRCHFVGGQGPFLLPSSVAGV